MGTMDRVFAGFLEQMGSKSPALAAWLEQERRYAAMTPDQRFIDAMNAIARTPQQVALREENARRLLRRAHGRAIYSGPLARRFVVRQEESWREKWEEANDYAERHDW